MRGCALSVMLLVLLAANGYSVWQIHLLRSEVARLDRALAAAEPEREADMRALAEAALEALRRGELTRAAQELERLGELIEEAGALARLRQRGLSAQLAAAQEAVSRGGEEAMSRVSELLQALPRGRQQKPPR